METTPTKDPVGNVSDSDTTVQSLKRPSRLRRWFMRFLLLEFSLIFALLVGEVAVRLVAPQVLFPRYVTGSPLGIRVPVPNARYTHTSPEMSVEFRLNAMGIRSDREYTLLKPPGVIRIIGLGDSFTQGYEVNVEETYLYQLEQILKERGYTVEVVNLGVSGFGNAEELIFLKEFGFRFNPDAVIVGHYTNDIVDNIRSNLYRLDENGQLVRAAKEYLPAIGLRNKLYSIWAYRMLAENSHLFAMMRERAASLIKRNMVKSQQEVHQPGQDFYGMRLTGQLFDQMKRECEARGITFLALDIPAEDLKGTKIFSEFVNLVEEKDVVRTAPRLRAEGEDAYLYRKQGHRHWTPRAHRIAAELLADRLTESRDP